jgi:Lrp/AsnC family transcriptional regulator for asnA, asnC and gidA
LPDQTKIDETDAKILKALLKDARTSFTEISKDCKISVAAVRKRYKRLWKEGIIKGEIMTVNPYSLGYECVSSILLETTKDVSKAEEFLKTKPYITLLPNPFGKYNIQAIITFHRIQELSERTQELEANPHIKHAEPLIWAKASKYNYLENILIQPFMSETEQKPPKKNTASSFEKAKIDKTDRQIAKILSQNARTPFKKIAEKLNISTYSVIHRYNRLRGKLLALSTITVDLKKLGYKAMAHIHVKTANKSKIPEICEKMFRIPNLIGFIESIGAYDLFAIVVLRDFEDLFNLEEQIYSIPYIEKVETFLKKPLGAWPPNLFVSLL